MRCLVCDKNRVQDVKKVVDTLNEQGRTESSVNGLLGKNCIGEKYDGLSIKI